MHIAKNDFVIFAHITNKAGIDIVNLSMGIQKGKYDGSNDAYRRLVNESDEKVCKQKS